MLGVALTGWFYTSKLPLPNYPGAFTFALDGPFKTEEDCKAMRQDWVDAMVMLGIKGEVSRCVERKDA